MDTSGQPPVFDVFALDGAAHSGASVSELFYTPSARGVALFVVGALSNSSGKYFIKLIAVDMTSGQSAAGRGLQLDLNTDQVQLMVFYPLDMATTSATSLQVTLPVYWKIGVDPPDATEYAMSIGAQLLA